MNESIKAVFKVLAVTAVAAAASAAFSPNAEARAIGGLAGHANPTSQDSCFTEHWNGVTNTCAAALRWNVPLAVDPGGNYSPNIAVFVSGPSSNVSCTVQAVTQSGTDFSNTGWFSPTQGNTEAVVVPGTVTVPGGGTLEASCVVSQGSFVHGVTW